MAPATTSASGGRLDAYSRAALSGGVRRSRLHWAVVLAAAVACRVPIVVALDTVTAGWHAADYGSIARNYYLNGLSFFYPQIDWGGAGPGYVEMEFPLLPYLTALIYALAGVADDRFAVILPFVSGVLAVAATFALAGALFRPRAALAAGLVTAVAPVLVRYSQMFFPEPTMLAASAGALYLLLRWRRSGSRAALAGAAACTALAVLLKPTALILGPPMLWLFWRREGAALWRRPVLYLFGLGALAPAIAWYAHAYGLAQITGHSFGILFGGGSNKLATLDLLLSREFYVRVAGQVVLYHVTPVATIAAAWALLRVRLEGDQWLVPMWLWWAAAGLLVSARGAFDATYYQLPIVPPAAILAGVGLVDILERLSATARPSWRPAVAATLGGVVLAGTALGAFVHDRRGDYVRFFRPLNDASRQLAASLRDGARIVLATPSVYGLPRGQHVARPFVFYFSGHRGWYLGTEWTTVVEVETARRDGGEYFVIERGHLEALPTEVLRYLETFGRVDDPFFAVWDMTRPALSPPVSGS